MNLNSALRTTFAPPPARHWARDASKRPTTYRNDLLRNFEQSDLEFVAPYLERVRLEPNRVLECVDRPIEKIYFPETGVISMIADSPGLGALEVGLVGAEGMTGVAVVMGATRSPREARVQLAGEGFSVAADIMADLLDQRPGLRRTVLSYARVFMDQLTQTALVNGRAIVDVRVARRLLMTADRCSDVDMPLTHEALARALGVRRPGVTDAIHRLEGQYLIKARRSSITLRDRAGLEALAGGSYGGLEREHARAYDHRVNTAG